MGDLSIATLTTAQSSPITTYLFLLEGEKGRGRGIGVNVRGQQGRGIGVTYLLLPSPLLNHLL